jgi:hypothetical protein
MANMAINHALMEKKQLYLLALDMRDAFGSVSHELLN